jgi:hypothetical protein
MFQLKIISLRVSINKYEIAGIFKMGNVIILE